ncbi:MAG: glycerol-3-phosphate acyltransferase [Anaerolineae bacterium]
MGTEIVASLVLAAVIGSVPSAYLVARAGGGVDIRLVGDGNVGARNVYRQVGPASGILVLAADLAKGAGAVSAAQALGLGRMEAMAAGVVVAVANDFTPWLRFQGGQGMAVSLGVLVVLLPAETLIAVAVALAVLTLTRHWDASWAVGLALIPFLAWIAGRPGDLVLYPVVLLPLIGAKKLIDSPRARRARSAAKGS